MRLGFLAAEFLSPRPLNHPFAYCAAAVLFQTLLFSTNGLYPAVGLHPAVELRHLVLSELQLAFVTVTYLGLVQDSWSSPYVIMASVSFLMAAGMIPIARSLTRSLVSRAAWWGYPTLLVGDRATCERVAQLFNRNGRQGFKPLGYFQDPDEYWSDSATETTEVPWLGPVSQVNEYARREQAYWLIISMPETLSPVMKSRFEDLRRRFPHVIVVDGRHDLPCLWNRAVDCGGIAAVKVEERLLMPEQQFSKRLLDLVLVTCALLVFAPLLAAITFVLWITNGRPIFYGARRIGRDGHEFMAWKFRSMVSNADQVLKQYLDAHPELRREFELDHKLKNDPRITRIGKILRRTSLDELPQLFNVLRGDMSLVGPRPIVTAEIAKYGEVYDLYLRVRRGSAACGRSLAAMIRATKNA